MASKDNSNFDPNSPDENKMFELMIGRARAGESNALGELIQSSRDYLLLIANRNLDQDIRHKVGASDIVQESLLTAQAKIGQFDGTSKSQWLAWLKQILINDLKQTRRSYKQIQKRSVHHEQVYEGPGSVSGLVPDQHLTPGTNAVQQEEMAIVQAAMAELPEDHQQVLKLRNWQQLTYEEIGKQMNRSPDAVRKIWGRAVLRLQEKLSRLSAEGNTTDLSEDTENQS